ncbi:unnamed protein product [Ectocarpus sp. CCAP 1310/34]|nr:unnamed protein product [Ectocarpus sp. CCAP 1310/34]
MYDAYKLYTETNVEGSRRVSSLLGDKEIGAARQAGENTVRANEHAVFVTAGNLTSSSSFDLATYNALSDTPNPGGDGVLSATMPTSNSAAISISASDTSGARNLSYRLYWSDLSTWTGAEYEWEVTSGCVIPTGGLSLLENPSCLFSSACGMYRASEGMFDWVTLPNDTGEYSFEAPVSRGAQYIFNVAMWDSNDVTSAYRASNMTFTFTNSQQCVADQGCQSQVKIPSGPTFNAN